jgi:hypothetical protein
MNDQTKLILAQIQINNLSNLLSDNKYNKFLSSHLISIQVELQRQLSHYAIQSTDME